MCKQRAQSLQLAILVVMGLAGCQGFYSPASEAKKDAVPRPIDGRIGGLDAEVPKIALPQDYYFKTDTSINTPPFQPLNDNAENFGVTMDEEFVVSLLKSDTSGLLSLSLNQFLIGSNDQVSLAIAVTVAPNAPAGMTSDCTVASVLASNRRFDLLADGRVCEGLGVNTCLNQAIQLNPGRLTEFTIEIQPSQLSFTASQQILFPDTTLNIPNATILIGTKCERATILNGNIAQSHRFQYIKISKR
jgi:hypothetical protein